MVLRNGKLCQLEVMFHFKFTCCFQLTTYNLELELRDQTLFSFPHSQICSWKMLSREHQEKCAITTARVAETLQIKMKFSSQMQF